MEAYLGCKSFCRVAGRQDVVRVEGFDDLQIRVHGHTHGGNPVVPFRQVAGGLTDPDQI